MENKQQLNDFLVKTFNSLLKIEGAYLSSGPFKGLSIREVHVMEEIARAAENGLDNRPSAIAAAQMVTAGTLTTTLNQLEKKGYIFRQPDPSDKRAVRLYLTPLGEKINQLHTNFHKEMVESILTCLNPEELKAMAKGLSAVEHFFKLKYNTGD